MFYGEICKVILKLSPNTQLICSTDQEMTVQVCGCVWADLRVLCAHLLFCTFCFVLAQIRNVLIPAWNSCYLGEFSHVIRCVLSKPCAKNRTNIYSNKSKWLDVCVWANIENPANIAYWYYFIRFYYKPRKHFPIHFKFSNTKIQNPV